MNIVTATFSAGCTQIDADRKLWQYDQGQILQLVGLDLPDSYQVEFSNSRDKGSAKAQIGGPDGVLIPDEYLTTGKPVYAFLVGHTAEEDRETEKLVVIYVNARSQPTDEPITPEQQSIVDQLIAALYTGVAKAEDAAEQAEAAIGYMPKIVDGDWWVYDAETETWADTGIRAEGRNGVGISGAVLNADYTLTLTFTDGSSYTTPSIRGPKGEDAPTDYILVQPTQPTSPTNRLWVDSDRGSTVQLPTMADHQALAEAVADNTEAIGDLSDELADQKSAIINETPVTLTLEQQKRYDVVNGVLNVLTGSSYNSYKSAIIEVNPGDTFLYSGRVYNYANQYSLIAVDSDNTPLKYELNNTSDTTVTDYSFTIPDGASQLIIQSYMTTPTLKLFKNAISDLNTKTEVLRSDIDEITIDARAQEYNNVMRSISRLGLSSVAPHNSRAAFLAAYRFGFRILLCDLRFTQDGVPVLFHDRYINQSYRNVYYTGGGMVSRDSQITIESLTAAQVQELEYRKTVDGVLTSFPIMFLDDMCLLVKQLGTELYLECKATLTAAQAETAGNIVLKYGIAGKTSWTADGANYLSEVVTKIPSARVASMPSTINASQITALKGLLTGQNEIFMFSWNTVVLTETIINLLIADNIPLEIGSIDGNEAILAYISQGTPYRYVSGIESNTTIAGKAVLENVLA